MRIINTEQGAWWETLLGTEPSRNRFAPVMPLLPTTIRSEPRSSATSRMASAGSPWRAKVSTSTPASRVSRRLVERVVDVLARVDRPLHVLWAPRAAPRAGAGRRPARTRTRVERGTRPLSPGRSAWRTASLAVADPSVPTTIEPNIRLLSLLSREIIRARDRPALSRPARASTTGRPTSTGAVALARAAADAWHADARGHPAHRPLVGRRPGLAAASAWPRCRRRCDAAGVAIEVRTGGEIALPRLAGAHRVRARRPEPRRRAPRPARGRPDPGRRRLRGAGPGDARAPARAARPPRALPRVPARTRALRAAARPGRARAGHRRILRPASGAGPSARRSRAGSTGAGCTSSPPTPTTPTGARPACASRWCAPGFPTSWHAG